MLRSEDIVDKVQTYHPEAPVDLLRKAYVFSAKAHQGQTRLSGEPYMSHPLAVAGILAELHLDVTTIAAGLLHDVLEDTPTDPDQIRSLFGEEVSFLVESLTKIAKIEFKTREEAQAENFRKMILSMARDIRVILIKLADRLNNMRTLKYLPQERQQAIAQETLDIYAPLANRLGIARIKWELEDLALQALKPEIYWDLVQRVSKRRGEREGYVEDLTALVERKLAEFGFQGEVTGRPKHFYSIYEKMQKQGIPFEEVYDLIALRIITDTKVSCYAILGMIHSLWTPVPGRFKDYIGVPKSNLYQSLHTTVVGPEGERVEIQIRTKEMHLIGEEGIAAHWRYKDQGVLDSRDEERFAWLRQMVEWQRDLTDAREFMDTMKVDLFPDVVYVFTPQGDVKELSQGATPVDFAYSVHSDVGHQCVGAKVNGKIVPLRYELRNGDTVEIHTQSGHAPTRDWLNFVKTSRARNRIKQWLKAEERTRSISLGRELLERELRRHNLASAKVFKADALTEVSGAMGFGGVEDLLAEVGFGRVSALQVVHRLFPDTVPAHEEKEKTLQRILRRVRRKRPPGVRISGVDDLLIHYARCCNPLPGDRIVGFVTRGRGVTIHTAECPNLSQQGMEPARVLHVEWEDSVPTVHPVGISVVTVDRPGMLASVTAAITATETNITHAEVTTQAKKANYDFVIEVKSLEHLQRVIQKIEQAKGVLNVKRTKAAVY